MAPLVRAVISALCPLWGTHWCCRSTADAGAHQRTASSSASGQSLGALLLKPSPLGSHLCLQARQVRRFARLLCGHLQFGMLESLPGRLRQCSHSATIHYIYMILWGVRPVQRPAGMRNRSQVTRKLVRVRCMHVRKTAATGYRTAGQQDTHNGLRRCRLPLALQLHSCGQRHFLRLSGPCSLHLGCVLRLTRCHKVAVCMAGHRMTYRLNTCSAWGCVTHTIVNGTWLAASACHTRQHADLADQHVHTMSTCLV